MSDRDASTDDESWGEEEDAQDYDISEEEEEKNEDEKGGEEDAEMQTQDNHEEDDSGKKKEEPQSSAPKDKRAADKKNKGPNKILLDGKIRDFTGLVIAKGTAYRDTKDHSYLGIKKEEYPCTNSEYAVLKMEDSTGNPMNIRAIHVKTTEGETVFIPILTPKEDEDIIRYIFQAHMPEGTKISPRFTKGIAYSSLKRQGYQASGRPTKLTDAENEIFGDGIIFSTPLARKIIKNADKAKVKKAESNGEATSAPKKRKKHVEENPREEKKRKNNEVQSTLSVEKTGKVVMNKEKIVPAPEILTSRPRITSITIADPSEAILKSLFS